MDKGLRTPFQGTWNVLRFNRHFYLLAVATIILLSIAATYLPVSARSLLQLAILLILVSAAGSLWVAYYVYDRSRLYRFQYLPDSSGTDTQVLVNVHAGFDETSGLLTQQYPNAGWHFFDFYDPEKHTEVSVKRARKACPPYPGTVPVTTSHIPLAAHSVDMIFLIFAAHEIRDNVEREQFFRQLSALLKPEGCIVLIEHQRDLANFLAFNIGFFHFYSPGSWQRTFRKSGLFVAHREKITPFVTYYLLRNHGNPA